MTFARPLVGALLLLSASSARAEETSAPLAGDLSNGARHYRLDCAQCHGVTGNGDGPLAAGLNPRPTRLRDGAFIWSHSDEEIIDAIHGDTLPPGAPMHGRGLSKLDARDILAWLKAPVIGISALYPTAYEYIAHLQTVDRDGQSRVEDVLGRKLTEAESKVMIFTVYKPDEGVKANGHPQKVPEDLSLLYNAKPRRRIGFVCYQQLNLDSGLVDVAMAMNNDARLVNLVTLPSSDPKVEKNRDKTEKLLKSYIGSGGRMDKKPVQPQEKGVKATKDVQAAMLLAFERLREGETMFLKEEQQRFALDKDAFDFPQADDQGEVKFQFKETKTK